MAREGKGGREEATEVGVSSPGVGATAASADAEAEIGVAGSTEEVNEVEFGEDDFLVEVDGRPPRAGRVARVARAARPRPRPRPRPVEGRDGTKEGEEATVTPDDLRAVERGFRAIERYLSAYVLVRIFNITGYHILSIQEYYSDYTEDVICKSY